MGQIIATGTFYSDPNKTVIMVKCDVPDRADNVYYLEVVRNWGKKCVWVKTWTSSPYYSDCLRSFGNCTV